MKIVQVHFATDPRTGDFVRIKRVREDVSRALHAPVKEIVLIKAWDIGRTLALRKSYPGGEGAPLLLPLIFPFRHYAFVRAMNDLLLRLFGYCAGQLMRPHLVIGETHPSWTFSSGMCGWSKKCRIVMDFHGVVAEEAEYSSGSWPTSRWPRERIMRYVEYLNTCEWNVLALADLLVVASDNMASYLEGKHHIKGKRVCVYQCGVDVNSFAPDYERRQRTRVELGVRDEEVLLVYVGGFHRWQMIDEMFRIVAELMKKADLDFRMLVLTQEKETMAVDKASLNGVDTSRLAVRSVSHTEVPAYINAADIGFLLREDTILNEVASPTKLAEYLACGKPVITGSVALKWGWIKDQERVLCVVDLSDPIEAASAINDYVGALSSDTEDISKKAVDVAQTRLSSCRDFIEIQRYLESLVAT